MNPDIVLSAGAWHDLYAATGIDPGTPLLIFSKGMTVTNCWEGAAPPIDTSQGVPIFGEPFVADQRGVTGAWVASMTEIVLCVQEYPDALAP